MPQRAGWRYKARINSTPYGVADADFDGSCDPGDVTNSEGTPGNPLVAAVSSQYTAVVAGTLTGRCTLRSATFDDSSNPFASPLDLRAGQYVTLRLYLVGTTGLNWYGPSMLVLSVRWNGQVRGLQPVTITLQSDGVFFSPDGSA